MSSPRIKGPKQEIRRTRNKQEMDDGDTWTFGIQVTDTGTIARTIGYNIQQIKSRDAADCDYRPCSVFSCDDAMGHGSWTVDQC